MFIYVYFTASGTSTEVFLNIGNFVVYSRLGSSHFGCVPSICFFKSMKVHLHIKIYLS